MRRLLSSSKTKDNENRQPNNDDNDTKRAHSPTLSNCSVVPSLFLKHKLSSFFHFLCFVLLRCHGLRQLIAIPRAPNASNMMISRGRACAVRTRKRRRLRKNM